MYIIIPFEQEFKTMKKIALSALMLGLFVAPAIADENENRGS